MKNESVLSNRDLKFSALKILIDNIRIPYKNAEHDQIRSYFEVVIGAAIFYLPSLNNHFNGFISLKALKGILNKERKVKDHIYPRKLASRELLEKILTLEEIKELYHKRLAQFMYITPSENSLLVNFYQEHENHDLAMESLQIEKFPTSDKEKFNSHKELMNFIEFIAHKEIHNKNLRELMLLLQEFRKV